MAARPPGAERPRAVRRVQGGPQQAARLAAGRIYSARGRKGRGPRERRSLFRGRRAADVELPYEAHLPAGQEAEVEGERSGRTSTGRGAPSRRKARPRRAAAGGPPCRRADLLRPRKKRTGPPGKAEPFPGETCGRRRTRIRSTSFCGTRSGSRDSSVPGRWIPSGHTAVRRQESGCAGFYARKPRRVPPSADGGIRSDLFFPATRASEETLLRPQVRYLTFLIK